eukprot:1148818-Pelagomonas_calceolata.AAC.1
MCMRTHLHAELIQAISIIVEHSPHQLNFYKVKATLASLAMREMMLERKPQPLWIPRINHCQMPWTLSTTPFGFPSTPPPPLRALPYCHTPLPH